MEITGKIVQMLPEQSGSGRNGTWRKQEVILETAGQYPKKVCLAIWGDKIDQFAVKPNDELTASIEVESREYNGRWYTDVKVWKVARGNSGGSGAPAPADPYPAGETFSSDTDDLPF